MGEQKAEMPGVLETLVALAFQSSAELGVASHVADVECEVVSWVGGSSASPVCV